MKLATDSPARLRVTGLTKSFFNVRVLHDVSFAAHAGRVLAVVGENGSGKSTTMNLLTGVLPRDDGEVLLDGQPFAPRSRRESDVAGVAFIQQELNIFPNLSVAENLFLGRFPRHLPGLPIISRGQLHKRAAELLLQVGLDVAPSSGADQLSAGERQLLEIARGLSHDARVFILDEPTTSLTASETEQLFRIVRQLKGRGVAILYITHNLEHVLHLADEVMVMRDGHVALQARCTDLKAADMVLAMVGRPIESLFPQRSQSPKGEPALTVSGLGEPGVLENINLCVRQGEIVGIAGLMGSGRSEFARALFGLDSYKKGCVRIGDRNLAPGNIGARLASGMAFLTEDRRREALLPNATVADNMALAALPLFAAHRYGPVRTSALLDTMRALSERLNLKGCDMCSTPVRTLSGGNQQKVVLGRWLLRRPKVFILDEPTRGIDVGAKGEIYTLLSRMADEGTAILVISSELEELTGLCDRILVMRRGAFRAELHRPQFSRAALLRIAFGQEDAA